MVPAGSLTVPVNVGDASGAFKANAACCAVETGLPKSDVLSTLPSPTIAAVIPLTVPVNVGDASGARRALLPLSFPIAERMVSVPNTIPVVEANPVSSFPVTVASAIVVVACPPVTSPDNSPFKASAASAFCDLIL